MTLDNLLDLLNKQASAIEFKQVMDLIDTLYDYTPTEFSNGLGEDLVLNQAGTNEGSCRLFAFALDQKLNQQQTLDCFGHYYREDVLQHPDNTDHANIRNFIKYGWDGINFSAQALQRK